MTVAHTKYGDIEGFEKNGIHNFRGIPYAKPPIGELRFKAPVEPSNWEDLKDCTKFGPVSWQSPGMLGGLVPEQELDCSEDCLSLNIQTPGLDDKKRPVLFWIHGGAFVGGSGSTPWYNGQSFASRGDVVVVSINYRLGVLGFLQLGEILGPEYQSSGLNGILDQVAALKFVRENIENFGGDPENVTIFGESAGAMSVGTLLGLPRAKGLFHKAILQSGSALNVLSKETADAVASKFVEIAELEDPFSLLELPPQEMLDFQTKVVAEVESNPGKYRSAMGGIAGLPLQPVLDGVELPIAPIEAIRSGQAKDIPIIAGTNKDEWKLFALMYPNPSDEEALIRRINRVGQVGKSSDTKEVGERFLAAYKKAFQDGNAGKWWEEILSDLVFMIPAIRLLEAQSSHQANVYHYWFTWESPAFGGMLGSCHAMEIPFVWNNLNKGGVELLVGLDPPEKLALSMHDAWISFAKHGTPDQEASVKEWPQFDIENRYAIEFNTELAILKDPRGETRKVWDDII